MMFLGIGFLLFHHRFPFNDPASSLRLDVSSTEVYHENIFDVYMAGRKELFPPDFILGNQPNNFLTPCSVNGTLPKSSKAGAQSRCFGE
jgi:hypothetical protein